MKNDIERDVIKNSEYIIYYFNKNKKDVTHLMLQKLLYFLEAIYMVLEDEDNLYIDDFFAWDFGPVNAIIYQKYKIFGNTPIELKKEITINDQNLKYIENLYELFKEYTAFNLVGLSHMEGSPWYEINKKYNDEIPQDIIIDKKKTKDWFKGIVTI